MTKLVARDMLLHDYRAGKASDYIRPFSSLQPADKVYLMLRVSGRERKRNLRDQEANLRQAVMATGAKIVGKTAIAVSGFHPKWVQAASRTARDLGATVLLAESTDRFIRNCVFRSNRPHLKDMQATEDQLKELSGCVGGITLMALVEPDASPSQVRSYQRMRGRKYKRAKGGRPKNRTPGFKKRRFEERIKKVLFFHEHQGWPVRRIAAKVKMPKSTVYDWLRKHKTTV